MNEHQSWKFNCKTCGGVSLTVTHVWTTLAGPRTERWQEWGQLEENHAWYFEFPRRLRKILVKMLGEETSVSLPKMTRLRRRKSTKFSNRKVIRKAMSILLIAQNAIARLNLAGRNLAGVDRYSRGVFRFHAWRNLARTEIFEFLAAKTLAKNARSRY